MQPLPLKLSCCWLALGLAACMAESASVPADGGPTIGLDAGAPDGGALPDAGPAASADAGSADAGTPDAGAPDAGSPDAGPPDAGEIAPDGGTYRSSLSVCWTDANCPRVFAIAHGGVWNSLTVPYLSNAAISEAYDAGLDGVKIDVRVTADNVPVLAHSSPIQLYESVDCYNQKIEDMTAAQVTACHRFPSTTETFQRLDDVLAYLRGKMVAQLTVKLSTDYARAIAEVNALGAQDFTFFEVSTSDLQTLIPAIPGSSAVYYLISIGQLSEVSALLNTIQNPRAFMFEFDPSVAAEPLTRAQLHPAGVRSFTYDSAPLASEGELLGLYDGGFDVVSSNQGLNGLQARVAVNTARGVSPP